MKRKVVQRTVGDDAKMIKTTAPQFIQVLESKWPKIPVGARGQLNSGRAVHEPRLKER